MRKLLIILMIIAFWGSSGFAEIYSWTDENGVKHFSTTPPPEDISEVKKAVEVQHDSKKDEAATREHEEWLNQKQQEESIREQEKQQRADQQKQEDEKAAMEAEKARIEAEKAKLEAEKARIEAAKKRRSYLRNQN